MSGQEAQKCVYLVQTAGVDDGEVPPVPIPNTVVKLQRAESSWGTAPCEGRTSPCNGKEEFQ